MSDITNNGLLLKVNGIALNMYASTRLNQTYAPVSSGSTIHRMLNGRAVKQTLFNKLRITTTGEGNIEAGFDGVDFNQPYTLSCVKPLQISGTSTLYTISANRRADAGYTPIAQYFDGRVWRDATFNLATNTITITANPNALQYRVLWYPELTVIGDAPNVKYDRTGSQVSWTLEAEEV